MIRKLLCSAIVLAVIASANFAYATPGPGSDAPDLGQVNWLLNAPENDKISELRGDVIIVERWGVNCPPCRALIPHLVQLQTKYGAQGLHIFTFESQNSSEDKIKALMLPQNVNYPVATSGGNAYQTGGGIPHAWVIGVDGKIIWEGNPRNGMDKVVEEELKKVKYPGLGKAEVAKEAVKVAVQYTKGQYTAARKEAKKLAENEKSSDEAKADAQFIAERVTKLAASKLEEAKAAEAAKDYAKALAIYDWIAKNFKGDEEGTAAEAKVKELKADKDVKREMDAQVAFNKIIDSVKKPGTTAVDYAAAAGALKGFVKKFEGTKAASDAEKILSQIK